MATTNQLSKLVNNMSESATIKMAQLARDLRDQGKDVISLSLGEPDFDTPDFIKTAAKDALDAGFTKYTPVPGLMELRNAIVSKLKNENGLDYKVDEIVVSNGAKQSFANICLALLDPGDEVVVLAPYWVSYKAIVEMVGAKVVPVSGGIETDYKPSAEAIDAAITDKTKLVIYSTPCNPTGSLFSKQELKAMADVFVKYPNLIVASDEIYELINFTDNGHQSIAQFDQIKDQVVVINGFAKGFAMTGWRLGYMAGPKWLAKACTKIQGQFTSGANAFGQRAGADALIADKAESIKMRDAFRARRDVMLQLLKEIPGMQVNHPEGAFYIFPNITAFYGKSSEGFTINNANDFCEYLLKDALVATVSGSAFGAPNCFRISYAASMDELKEAAKRIKISLAKLN